MYKSEKRNKMTNYVVAACVIFFVGCGLYQLLARRIGLSSNIISLVSMATLFKALSTGGKYLYQIVLNFQRKSCKGLSTSAIVSDFLGACCCLAQIQLDSYIAGYAFFLTYPDLNIAKFLLAFLTFTCEAVILSQIVYYSKKDQ